LETAHHDGYIAQQHASGVGDGLGEASEIKVEGAIVVSAAADRATMELGGSLSDGLDEWKCAVGEGVLGS